jgi:hypothetical protein
MMIDSVGTIYFKELAEKNPEDVCRRAQCSYDAEKKCYTLPVWGDAYAIYPYESNIIRLSNRFQQPHEYLYLFIIHYLLKSKEIELFNQWISEKDVPGGTTFFRGPHEIPTNFISERYCENIKEFRDHCEQLEGNPVNMADAAYIFIITPRIPVAVLFWEGDDEFPTESRLLFDKSITEHLASDIIFALAVDVCTRIGKDPGPII